MCKQKFFGITPQSTPCIFAGCTKKTAAQHLNCTPFVRQYGILFRKWGCFCMPEKKKQKTYSGEFKIEVVETMRKENLSYKETVRHFGLRSDKQVRMWERIYLEEGKEALLLERRGRACASSGTRKGRKPKLDKQVEEDLIAENQRLRMEIDYLKKLRALVLEEERQNRKHK